MMKIEQIYPEVNIEKINETYAIRELILDVFPHFQEKLEDKTLKYYFDGHELIGLSTSNYFITFYIYPFDLFDSLDIDWKLFNIGENCLRISKVTQGQLEQLMFMIDFIGHNYKKSELLKK